VALQKRIAQIGLAKQSAKGTPSATATYLTGVKSGNIVSADISEDDLNSSWTSRIVEGADRTAVVPGVDFEGYLTPALAGLLLYGATGADAVTGPASGVYTHSFTPYDDLPYLTFLANYASLYYQMQDAKIDEFELSFDGAAAVTYKAKAVGTNLIPLASVFTSTNSERPQNGVFKGAGGTFTVGGSAAKVKSGSIKIKNNIEAILLANAVTPDDVFPGMVSCDVSLTIVVPDLNYWRTFLTGSTGGTSITSAIYTGAVDLKFIKDANTDLDFTASTVHWTTKFPDADPSGGPAELTLEGSVMAPASGAAFTFALRNAVVSY
jgi:hypothetical protein